MDVMDVDNSGSDDLALILMAEELLEEENSGDEEEMIDAGAMLAIGLEGRALNSAGRRPNRLYLRRDELQINPRHNSGWQGLWKSQSDRAFITTMGIDVRTFNIILDRGFQFKWETQPIPRDDVSPTSIPRGYRRSLDAAGALGLALHWLSSTMREVSLQQIFALIPTTVNRYLDFALKLLDETLATMPEASIKWPRGRRLARFVDLLETKYPKLSGGFGFVDGLNLPVQVSNNQELENATYNGWLHDHFVSNVLAFAPTGMYLNLIRS